MPQFNSQKSTQVHLLMNSSCICHKSPFLSFLLLLSYSPTNPTPLMVQTTKIIPRHPLLHTKITSQNTRILHLVIIMFLPQRSDEEETNNPK